MRRNLIVIAALVLLVPLAWAAGDPSDNDRGYLGVTLHSTEMIHQDDGTMEHRVGLLIGNVMRGGAAEVAGLQARDKIVAIDGRDVTDMDSLHEAMGAARKGDRLSVTVERDGREQTFDLVLGEMPKKRHVTVERFGAEVGHSEDRGFVGIESQPVGSQLAEYFGVEGGILVTNVIEGTAAQNAGIEAGDVIVAWGETPIRKVHDLHGVIGTAKPGDQIELSVSRRGVESQVLITLGSARDFKEAHADVIHEDHEGDDHFDPAHDRHIDVKVIETKGGGE